MDKTKKEAIQWYSENRTKYEKLCAEVKDILKGLFEDSKITYIDITSRAKTLESFEEKCKKDKYKDPKKEIQDLSGIRIITYTNSEVEKICKIIESEFEVNKENSSNKKNDIEVDRFGYLSVHYIATLKDEYTKIGKYKRYEKVEFEIQVRTLLQHAWSEIEHDRNYKFKGALPKDLKRRFYMIAGVLELVDKEFDLLTYDITNYSLDTERRLHNGDYNIELSGTAIRMYLKIRFGNIEFNGECKDNLIFEMSKYGIKTINDIETIYNNITEENKDLLLEQYEKNASITGFIRDLMIINNANKYFSNWDNNWDIEEADVEYFERFNLFIEHTLDKYNIEIEEDNEYFEDLEEEDFEEDEYVEE